MTTSQHQPVRRHGDVQETAPLRHWKLIWIDVEGLNQRVSDAQAPAETLRRSHAEEAPFPVIRAGDERRTRIAALRAVLVHAAPPDARHTGGPEICPCESDG